MHPKTETYILKDILRNYGYINSEGEYEKLTDDHKSILIDKIKNHFIDLGCKLEIKEGLVFIVKDPTITPKNKRVKISSLINKHFKKNDNI